MKRLKENNGITSVDPASAEGQEGGDEDQGEADDDEDDENEGDEEEKDDDHGHFDHTGLKQNLCEGFLCRRLANRPRDTSATATVGRGGKKKSTAYVRDDCRFHSYCVVMMAMKVQC